MGSVLGITNGLMTNYIFVRRIITLSTPCVYICPKCDKKPIGKTSFTEHGNTSYFVYHEQYKWAEYPVIYHCEIEEKAWNKLLCLKL